jgi:glycosyltransferase EpsD
MAMGIGLPLIVTHCRGNIDLVTNEYNGLVVGLQDIEGFKNAVERLTKSNELREKFSKNNLELIKAYSIESISKEMSSIYQSYLI